MGVTVYAGDFRLKVIFKAPVTTQDDGGSLEVTYPADSLTTHAAVHNVSGHRNTEAGSTKQLNKKEFFIRWSPSRKLITKDWLLVYEGNEYIIDGVDPVEEGKNRLIKFTAKVKA